MKTKQIQKIINQYQKDHEKLIKELLINLELEEKKEKQKLKNERLEKLRQTIEIVLNIDNLLEKTHKHHITAGRSIFNYILYTKENFTYSELARIHDQDHTTVINSVKKYDEFYMGARYKEKFNQIIKMWVD